MSHFTGCHDHINPARMDATDDSDSHEQWLLERPDVELLEVAIYHLPPHVLNKLAGVVRAIYATPGNDEFVSGALDATAVSFADYIKGLNDE